MNLVEAKVSGGRLSFAGFDLPLSDGGGLSAYDGRDVILGIRPSDLEDTDVWHNDRLPTIEVTAEVTEELGSEVNIIFAIDAPPVQTEDTSKAISDEEEDNISLLADQRPRARFTARVDSRTTAKPGQTIRLSIDPQRFHFFDPATGSAIEAARAVPAGV
jgi:multiple sugar transport system ATP-binding protein